MISREQMQALLKISSNRLEVERHSWFTFELEGSVVHVLLEGRFDEGRGVWMDLPGNYSALIHSPHTAACQRHVHAYYGRKKMFALNWDGSTRHGTSGTKIPNKLARGLSAKCRGLQIPPGNVLEQFDAPEWLGLMFEAK